MLYLAGLWEAVEEDGSGGGDGDRDVDRNVDGYRDRDGTGGG